MCGYVCKGFCNHHVLQGDNVNYVIGLGSGQTVFVCLFVLLFYVHILFVYLNVYYIMYLANSQ